jgi:hypothetical protein
VGITRRKFITHLTVGLAGLPWLRGESWAHGKVTLGSMKIVDNAAMFMAMEQGFFTAEGLTLAPLPMAGGEQAPVYLARLRAPRWASSLEEIAKALTGHDQPEQGCSEALNVWRISRKTQNLDVFRFNADLDFPGFFHV